MFATKSSWELEGGAIVEGTYVALYLGPGVHVPSLLEKISPSFADPFWSIFDDGVQGIQTQHQLHVTLGYLPKISGRSRRILEEELNSVVKQWINGRESPLQRIKTLLQVKRWPFLRTSAYSSSQFDYVDLSSWDMSTIMEKRSQFICTLEEFEDLTIKAFRDQQNRKAFERSAENIEERRHKLFSHEQGDWILLEYPKIRMVMM